MSTAVTPDGAQLDTARLAELCERYGVSELSVFGSVARGDARPDSDIDLLFALAPGTRLGSAAAVTAVFEEMRAGRTTSPRGE